MRWRGFDKGREGMLAKDKWLGVLQIIARHEGEVHSDTSSPIFAELQRYFPEDSWTGGSKDRSLFRDYAAAWVGTGALKPLGETNHRFELTSRGRAVVVNPQGLAEFFRDVLDNYTEVVLIDGTLLSWSPIEIIAAVLRAHLHIDVRELERYCSRLAVTYYPQLALIHPASEANNYRRFRTYLKVLENAGAIQLDSGVVSVVDPEYMESMSRPAVSWTADEVESDLHVAGLGVDERRRQERDTVIREGQTEFAQRLKTAYSGKCCVTGTTEIAVLEAAHILPYMGRHSNGVQNGLLLAVDIHRLFDKKVLGINPGSLTIELAERVEDRRYRSLQGSRISVPHRATERPSHLALTRRYEEFLQAGE